MCALPHQNTRPGSRPTPTLAEKRASLEVIERALLEILSQIEQFWGKDGDLPVYAKVLLLMTEVHRLISWALARVEKAKEAITPKLKGGGK